jgi:hypothetical protein
MVGMSTLKEFYLLRDNSLSEGCCQEVYRFQEGQYEFGDFLSLFWNAIMVIIIENSIMTPQVWINYIFKEHPT